MRIRIEATQDRRGAIMFKVQLEQEDSVEVKTMDYDSFITLMTASAGNESYIHLGEISPNYVDAAIAKTDSFKIFLKSPAQKRLMLYAEGHYWIPFPGCLFFLRVYQGALQEMYLYSIADTEITAKTQLYHYPFGNVASNGGVCMGNIHFQNLTFKDADKIVEAFFLGKTNNDLYNTHNVKPAYSLSQLIHKLEKREIFPKRWLSECEGMTYAKLKEQKL